MAKCGGLEIGWVVSPLVKNQYLRLHFITPKCLVWAALAAFCATLCATKRIVCNSFSLFLRCVAGETRPDRLALFTALPGSSPGGRISVLTGFMLGVE